MENIDTLEKLKAFLEKFEQENADINPEDAPNYPYLRKQIREGKELYVGGDYINEDDSGEPIADYLQQYGRDSFDSDWKQMSIEEFTKIDLSAYWIQYDHIFWYDKLINDDVIAVGNYLFNIVHKNLPDKFKQYFKHHNHLLNFKIHKNKNSIHYFWRNYCWWQSYCRYRR